MLTWLIVYLWLCVSLLSSLFLGESCPARGWQCCWEIKEHTSLWLGGMLQRRSWLWNKFFIRQVFLPDLCLQPYLPLMNDDVHVKFWLICLLLLCIWMIMLHNMFYVLNYHASALYACMFMFMGLDTQLIWCVVASSSSIEGLGTLQCGIRALVAAWAWMGCEDAVTELMLQQLGLRGPWKD